MEDEIKEERNRIWTELFKILPINDYGDLEQGDEVHKIVFNTDSPIILKRDIDFKKAVEPAIRYLFQNHNPHTKILIDYDVAVLLQSEKCHNLRDEVPD